jgi:DNA topoisomerase IA
VLVSSVNFRVCGSPACRLQLSLAARFDGASCIHLQDKAALQRNLEAEARRAEQLVLWLDCDREGENIGFEVSLCSWRDSTYQRG